MTALVDPPRNGRVPPAELPGSNSTRPATNTGPADDTAEAARATPALDLHLPEIVELDRVTAHARSIVERQDAPELREAMQFSEIQAERTVRQEHRAAMLQDQRRHNTAVRRRARAALRVQNKLEAQSLRDELDASRAQALLKRMTNPVAYLASQMRARRIALTLGAAPALVAVFIGAVQSQEAWVRVWNVTDVLLRHALYGFEPLFTLPLVAILLYEAAAPGGSVRTMREMWFRKADFEGDQIEFGLFKMGLLIASVLINVLPHVLLGEWSGLAWFAVPAAIVISLFLVPKIAVGFGQRIINARSDAELGAPVGVLQANLAKLARQKRYIDQRLKNGTHQGLIDEETGLPSANGIRRMLTDLQGAAGMPDAQLVRDFMSVERGIKK